MADNVCVISTKVYQLQPKTLHQHCRAHNLLNLVDNIFLNTNHLAPQVSESKLDLFLGSAF